MQRAGVALPKSIDEEASPASRARAGLAAPRIGFVEFASLVPPCPAVYPSLFNWGARNADAKKLSYARLIGGGVHVPSATSFFGA